MLVASYLVISFSFWQLAYTTVDQKGVCNSGEAGQLCDNEASSEECTKVIAEDPDVDK